MIDCPFCVIATGQTHAFYVPTREPAVMAFVPLRPAVWGHLLVCPRIHAEHLWEVPDSVLYPTISEVKRLAGLASACVDSTAFNVVLNDGAAAYQTIPHVHFHLLPRKVDDELGPLPLSAEYGSARYYDDAREQMAEQWKAGVIPV